MSSHVVHIEEKILECDFTSKLMATEFWYLKGVIIAKILCWGTRV